MPPLFANMGQARIDADYLTVSQQAQDEFVERKSRFIGAAMPITTEQNALGFIAEKRSKYWDATHNCYAYILRAGTARFSDDGEPSGTAGIPILDVMRKEGVFDTVIVVTRYFGGIMLGAGGLVRAYTAGAKLALDAAGRLTMRSCTDFSLLVPYTLYGRVESLVHSEGALILNSDFGEQISLSLRLPSVALSGFEKKLTEATSGALIPEITQSGIYCSF